MRRGIGGMMAMMLVVAMVAVAGCTPERGAVSPEVRLRGALWRAVEIDGSRVEFLRGQKLDVSLVLYASGTFRAATGCSNTTGSYSLKGSRIAFSGITPESRPCPPAITKREAAFLRALKRAATYERRGGRLSLYDRKGGVLLRCIAVQGR
ncbi:META domain-containing protein [Chlorobium sp. N1]|uniref:META domain-containing protein n=1 Tax=Chlorobium sp. N1 TaxID=2491138 RepID=UPI0013F14578|nr:META domain-containing protein [Chlorobium sp. N1]